MAVFSYGIEYAHSPMGIFCLPILFWLIPYARIACANTRHITPVERVIMKKNQIKGRELQSISDEFIERRIYLIRGQKVMIDSDLADLYAIEARVLNQAVKRNINRFPPDFMFQLSHDEVERMNSSQIVMSSKNRGSKYRPYAFTELGVAMLSSVLKSDRAVQMNIHIMRAFVALRQMLATHAGLARKIGELEKDQREQQKHLIVISAAVNKLIEANKPRKSAIGFRID